MPKADASTTGASGNFGAGEQWAGRVKGATLVAKNPGRTLNHTCLSFSAVNAIMSTVGYFPSLQPEDACIVL
jgi:hypothetical protein